MYTVSWNVADTVHWKAEVRTVMYSYDHVLRYVSPVANHVAA
jgi:hypothetical protein